MNNRIFVFFACLIFAKPCIAMDAEGVFKQANAYTVRIDVAITMPFIEDDRGAGHGAGFIVDRERRLIMTNAHVVGYSPSRMEVLFADGTRLDAKKVYVDPYLDLAILALEDSERRLVQAPLDCKNEPATGHPVGAYGHPWGLDFTGTQGVVSGKTTESGPQMLLTDTPINGGNSGGPLISMRSGKVVGINTSQIASTSDQNTNFALPIKDACRVLSLLQEGSDPSPPRLAMRFFDTKAKQKELLVSWFDQDNGSVGILRGDRITAVNDTKVNSVSELISELRGRLSDAIIIAERNGQAIKIRGTFEAEPAVQERQGLFFAGMLIGENMFHDMTGINGGASLMVHSVESGSEGHAAGLGYLDFVTHVNGVDIMSLKDLEEQIALTKSDQKVVIDFLEPAGNLKGVMFNALRREFDKEEPQLVGVWTSSTAVVKGELAAR